MRSNNFYKRKRERLGIKTVSLNTPEDFNEHFERNRKRGNRNHHKAWLVKNRQLTPEQEKRLWSLSDKETCRICRVEGKLVLDHCHKTGKFRGFICGLCNTGLGFFKDSEEALLNAIEYLQEFKGSETGL